MCKHPMFIHEEQLDCFNNDVRKIVESKHPEYNTVSIEFAAAYMFVIRWLPYCKSPDFIM